MIAYDARYITAAPTGIGHLCLELLRGFAHLPSRPPLQVLITPETPLPLEITAAPHLQCWTVPWGPYGLRNQLLLPRLLRQHGVRLLHSIDAFQPVWSRGICRLVTIHDLIHFTCPQFLRKSRKRQLFLLWKTWLQWQCASAHVVITVSQHSATDLTRLLHVPPHKIRVVHNPVRQWDSHDTPAAFRQRFGLHKAIIAYVGRHDPYKNLINLIRAMALLTPAYKDTLQLVIAGPLDPRYPEAYAEVHRLGLTDTVVFPGYLDEASLGALYTTSAVFVFPSLYEGFGLPPLEAMSCGTPVVAHHGTALPEVLGDAALFVDARDPQALADGIRRVLTDPLLAQQLSRAGAARAALFSAQRAAEQHLALYEQVLTQY